MSEFDNSGKSALWDKRPDAGPRAPHLRGEAYAHRDIKKGEKLELAYWPNEQYVEGGNKPHYKGKMTDGRGAQPAAPKAEAVYVISQDIKAKGDEFQRAVWECLPSEERSAIVKFLTAAKANQSTVLPNGRAA